MYHVSTQGVDVRMINVHYYYYYYLHCWVPSWDSVLVYIYIVSFNKMLFIYMYMFRQISSSWIGSFHGALLAFLAILITSSIILNMLVSLSACHSIFPGIHTSEVTKVLPSPAQKPEDEYTANKTETDTVPGVWQWYVLARTDTTDIDRHPASVSCSRSHLLQKSGTRAD